MAAVGISPAASATTNLEEGFGTFANEGDMAKEEEEDVMLVDPEEALRLARKQVADVFQELVQLRKELHAAKKKALTESRKSVLEAVRHAHAAMPHHPEARGRSTASGLDAVEVERSIRHLEADRDNAQARADHLQDERDQLAAGNAQLDAELKQAQRALEQTTQDLRHRDLDVHHLSVGAIGSTTKNSVEGSYMPASYLDTSVMSAGMSRIQDTTASLQCPSVLDSFHGGHCKPGGDMSKKQAMAAIVSLQAQLQQEQQKRRKLQQRVQKDRERMEGLFQLVERQRDELISTRRNATQRSPTAELPSSPFGAFGSAGGLEGSPLLQRSPSTPTKLPSVAQRRS